MPIKSFWKQELRFSARRCIGEEVVLEPVYNSPVVDPHLVEEVQVTTILEELVESTRVVTIILVLPMEMVLRLALQGVM